MLIASLVILCGVISLIVGAWLKSIFNIKLTVTVPYNFVAVVERFGRPARSLGTGLHLLLPWERVRGFKYLRTERNKEPFRFSGLTADNVRIDLELRLGISIAPQYKSDPMGAYYKCMTPNETALRFLPDILNRLLPQMTAMEIYNQPGNLTAAAKELLDAEIESRYGHCVRDLHVLRKQLPAEIETRLQRQFELDLAMRNEALAGRVEAARTNSFESERVPVELETLLSREQTAAQVVTLQAEADADAARSRNRAEVERIAAVVQALQSGSPEEIRAVQALLAHDYVKALSAMGSAANARTILFPGSPGAAPGWPEQFALLGALSDTSGSPNSAAVAGALGAQIASTQGSAGSGARPLPPPAPPAPPTQDA